jgi:hypothetical protein
MACSKKGKALRSAKHKGKGGPGMMGAMGLDSGAGSPPASGGDISGAISALKSAIDSMAPEEKAKIGSMTVDEAIAQYGSAPSPLAPSPAPLA